MRIRTIKPEFWQSESVGRLSRNARLLFIGLWSVADDAGKARAASRFLASTLAPYDEDAPDLIEEWLNELEAEGMIRRYTVGKNSYLEIPNWSEHQRIDRPSPSKIPPFDASSRILASPLESSCEEQGTGNREQGTGNRDSESACDPEFVARIVAAYPVRTDQAASEKAVIDAIAAGEDPDVMLAGTLAIAAVIADAPSGARNKFVPGPARFFRERKYRDDPAVWRARFSPEKNGIAKAFPTEAPQPGLKPKIL